MQEPESLDLRPKGHLQKVCATSAVFPRRFLHKTSSRHMVEVNNRAPRALQLGIIKNMLRPNKMSSDWVWKDSYQNSLTRCHDRQNEILSGALTKKHGWSWKVSLVDHRNFRFYSPPFCQLCCSRGPPLGTCAESHGPWLKEMLSS